MTEQPKTPEQVEEMLHSMWAKIRAEPAPKPVEIQYREHGDLAFPLGTKIQVTAVDPDWNYAGSGYPSIGSVGKVVSDPYVPVGRTCVQFLGSSEEPGLLRLTDGSYYTGLDDRHMLMFLPDNCLCPF